MSQGYYRNFTLDLMRTLAIVLMVIFHFLYDLTHFGWVDWDTPDGEGWRQFRWVIISLFFLALGISLCFAHQPKIMYYKFFKRVLQIAAGALLISVSTYFVIHSNWIFFGVLHFLAFASIVCIGFVKKPRLSFVIGLTFLIVGFAGWVKPRWPFDIFFANLPSYTNDYVAIFPWLGMVFIGITLGHSPWFKSDPLKHLQQRQYSKYAVWPGQHGLSIYLLHQPILIALLYVVSLLV